MSKRKTKQQLWIPDLKQFKEQQKARREQHILRLSPTAYSRPIAIPNSEALYYGQNPWLDR